MDPKQALTFDDTEAAFKSRSTFDLRKSHFVFGTMKYPWMVRLGIFLTTAALDLRLPVKGLIKWTIFRQFCGGESIHDSARTIEELGKFNVQTILDYSVEGQQDEQSFDNTMEEALRVIAFARANQNITFCVIKITGLGSSALLAKVQTGEDLSEEEAHRLEKMKERADKIAKSCAAHDLRFMIDAEESWIQDKIDEISYELMKRYNKERAVVYNTYQFYRHDALARMKTAFEDITSAGCLFAVKIVRGAYMEKERERAEEQGYADPIQPTKEATDQDFDLAQRFVMDNLEKVSLCAGTHNEASCSLLVRLMRERSIAPDDERIYFAQLLGMSDNISFKLAQDNFNVAKYVPYGPVRKVLPYLFRRAEENTAIAGQTGRELTLVKREIRRRRKK